MRSSWSRIAYLVVAALMLVGRSDAATQKIDYLQPTPLVDRVKVKAQPVKDGPVTRVPLITWGADVQTIATEMNGTFQAEGLKVELFCENKFQKQVEGCLSGQTPYLRGTMDMIVEAAEVFKANGLDLVIPEQRSWSNGGDAFVARAGIRTPKDLEGKTIALQLDGPHMYYVTKILTDAGVNLATVKFKWLEELTLPTGDVKTINDPVSAFREDPSLDAVMCIIPDALALTSGGNIGDGSQGSVEGAHILLTTKTGNRLIVDVYAARSDFFANHRTDVEKFTAALLKGEENWRDLLAAKDTQQAKYMQVVSRSAEILLGSSSSTADVEAMIGDAELAGYTGNVAFFTGKGVSGKETRTLETLSAEIQPGLKAMGLLKSAVTLKSADWDYATLANGLRYATNVPAPKPKFDAEKMQAAVSEKVAAATRATKLDTQSEKVEAVEAEAWTTEGTLFSFEINFKPNQSSFEATTYQEAYQKALEMAQSYGGAIVAIEGHADPKGILDAAKKGATEAEISEKKQSARNLSLQRARAARESFIKDAKAKGYDLDPNQFMVVGFGISAPLFNPPKTEAEWNANRRVVFRVKNVEAELASFTPSSGK